MPLIEITAEDLLLALEHAALDMIRQKDVLCDLDAKTGDGDLGVTIELGCHSLEEGVATLKGADIGTILAQSGGNFSRSASSTFGVLVAAAFRAAGKCTEGQRSIGLSDLVKIGETVVQEIQRRGGARLGDKTMLDSIVPAVEALARITDEPKSLPEALEVVTRAAEAGMQSTFDLRARFGRASWLGDRSVGVPDAGATAVYLFLKSIAAHLVARFAVRTQ